MQIANREHRWRQRPAGQGGARATHATDGGLCTACRDEVDLQSHVRRAGWIREGDRMLERHDRLSGREVQWREAGAGRDVLAATDDHTRRAHAVRVEDVARGDEILLARPNAGELERANAGP